MHIVFIPYGKIEWVETLLRDMRAQKHQWKMWKGKKEQTVWLQGQVRVLPFGVYEYVFPKEDRDKVLSTLGDRHVDNALGKTIKTLMRKALKLKKIPENYETKLKYLWIREYVSVYILGIREDKDNIGKDENKKDFGWEHEAI